MSAPKALFDVIRRKIGPLASDQVKNIEFLYGYLRTEPHSGRLLSPPQRAHIWAEIHHETGGVFRAIREKKAHPIKNPKIWAMQRRYWDTGFYGRGPIQITWERNYRRASEILRKRGRNIDCVANPDAMLDWENGVIVAVDGVVVGWFTGRKLPEFVGDSFETADHFNARRTVNGVFHADRVAALAELYEGQV